MFLLGVQFEIQQNGVSSTLLCTVIVKTFEVFMMLNIFKIDKS